MEALKKAQLVMYPPVEWGGLYQRPQHLAVELSRFFKKVFYLQPAGLRNPKTSDLRRLRGFFSAKKKNHHSQFGNLCVKRLPFLPIHGLDMVERTNSFLLDRFLKGLGNEGRGGLVFWIGASAPFLKFSQAVSNKRPIIFDWMDDYAIFSHLPKRVRETQDEFLKRADIVFASSKKLLDMAKRRGARKAFLLPNGVDVSFWERKGGGRLKEMLGIDCPIVGYFGTISHWLDGKLVSEISKRFPLCSFVFIGPRADEGCLDGLFSLENCIHVPQVNYEELPALADDFDVCWMPFKTNELTETINPVKVYEYLAMGKPVVAPSLPDLTGLRDVVFLARSGEEWGRGLELALSEMGDEALIRRRRQAARDHSWNGIAETAAKVLNEACKVFGSKEGAG